MRPDALMTRMLPKIADKANPSINEFSMLIRKDAGVDTSHPPAIIQTNSKWLAQIEIMAAQTAFFLDLTSGETVANVTLPRLFQPKIAIATGTSINMVATPA